MRRLSSIIAVFAVNLGASAFTITQADTDAPPRFEAYSLELQISRNGVALYSPTTTVVAGQASRLDSQARVPAGLLRVNQRVSAFPGSKGNKALVELELYGVSAARSQRIVAPTLGVVLGQAQTYEMRTDQGLVRIRALVHGLRCDAAGVDCPQPTSSDRLIEAPAGRPSAAGT